MIFLGYLVTDVFDKMVRKRNGELKPPRKLYIYSGHDVTLVNVMRALDIIPQTSIKPDYASALHFELHRNPELESDMEVKVNDALNFYMYFQAMCKKTFFYFKKKW